MEIHKLVYPCYWSERPCQNHERYYNWAKKTYSDDAESVVVENTANRRRGILISLPNELIRMILECLECEIDRACFALVHPLILAALGSDVFTAVRGSRHNIALRLERDVWKTMRYCSDCLLLHDIGDLNFKDNNSDFSTRLHFISDKYQLSTAYIKLAIERFNNHITPNEEASFISKKGVCHGLLRCNHVLIEPLTSFSPPPFPTTSYAFPAFEKHKIDHNRSYNHGDVRNAFYCGCGHRHSLPIGLMRMGFAITGKGYYFVRDLLKWDTQGTVRQPFGSQDQRSVLAQLKRYDDPASKYAEEYAAVKTSLSARFIVTETEVALDGLLSIHLPFPGGYHRDMDAIQYVLSLELPLCPHTSTKFHITEGHWRFTFGPNPKNDLSYYRSRVSVSTIRWCNSCKTEFRIYDQPIRTPDKPANADGMMVLINIRRKLGGGRLPEDQAWWTSGELESDLYESKDIAKLSA